MTFNLTDAELALAVPTGAVLVGVISYLGARRGSRDLVKTQEKVIQSQEDLVKLQRVNVLLDMRAVAYVRMIGVLLKLPDSPKITADTRVVKFYSKQLNKWLAEYTKSLAPLHAFADPETLHQLLDKFSSLQQSSADVNKELKTLTGLVIDWNDGVKVHVDNEAAYKRSKQELDFSYNIFRREARDLLEYLRGQLQAH